MKDDKLKETMRLEWDVECYICQEEILTGTLSSTFNEETGYGFTWGSDGVYPDGASAMYCCNNCKSFWIGN